MKKIRKWIIVSKDGKYVCANSGYNHSVYTDNIDDACVFYSKSEATLEKTEPGEKVIEIETRNRIPIKTQSQADAIEKLLNKAKKKK